LHERAFLGVCDIWDELKCKPCTAHYIEQIAVANIPINIDVFMGWRSANDCQSFFSSHSEDIEWHAGAKNSVRPYRYTSKVVSNPGNFAALHAIRADFVGNTEGFYESHSFSAIKYFEMYVKRHASSVFSLQDHFVPAAQFGIRWGEIWPFSIASNISSGSGSSSGIAGGERANPSEYERHRYGDKSNSTNDGLPKRVLGGSLSGSGHSLLLTQICLAVVIGIATWGPIFGGIGLIVFGNFLGASDIPVFRFFSGWNNPRIVGLLLLCGGLALFGLGIWLIALLSY